MKDRKVSNERMGDDEIVNRLSIVCKLMYMQVRPGIEMLKEELKMTKKQKGVYLLCDGENQISEIAKKAKCSQRYVEKLLPEWEKKGLIISVAKGPSKRYVNIENLQI